MPKKRRRTRKQPEPAPAAGKRKRRVRRPRKTSEPEPVAVARPDNAPKTVMQQIFENQREQLNEMNEALRAKVFGDWFSHQTGRAGPKR
jgi:hypothetical protein